MLKKITLGGLFPLFTYAAEINNQNSSTEAILPASFSSSERSNTENLPEGYNQSANYNLPHGCDLYVTANFLYWHVNQWPLILGNLVHTTATGSVAAFNGTSTTQSIQPSYKGGFQIGSGFKLSGMDNWNLYAEYTWYQNSSNKSVKPGPHEVLSVADFFKPGIYGSRVLTADSLNGAFSFHYNGADLSFLRPFYFSKKITANFGLGLKGLWISESVSLSGTGLAYGDPLTTLELIPEPGTLHGKSHRKSWGVGPRFEFASNWLLGCGFKLIGDLTTSVLYTRYTKHDTSAVTSLSNISSFSQSNYGTLRAVTESCLGLGWGWYLGSNNGLHLDLITSYDFNILWNQNLIVTGASSNIYLHGLNVAARLDF